MSPRPPSWINAAITIWPNSDRSVPVSTTTNPVTVTAEVAMNSASERASAAVPALAIGSISKAPPIPIRAR